MSWFPFKNRASTMPGMNGHLCVFHEACSASSRRVLQGIQQTRSLLSGSLKQPSPNLTSLVPEKCPRIPTSSQTQARLGRAARFQHQEPLLRPPELPGPQPPSSQPGPHPMGPRQSPVWPPGLVGGTSSDSLRWPLWFHTIIQMLWPKSPALGGALFPEKNAPFFKLHSAGMPAAPKPKQTKRFKQNTRCEVQLSDNIVFL